MWVVYSTATNIEVERYEHFAHAIQDKRFREAVSDWETFALRFEK